MVPFSGKCGFVTYVPSKPNPLGLKCFVLAAPDGLVLDFMFHAGSGTVSAEDMKEYGLSAAVVKMMTESVPRDNQHCVYTDRFFTSVKSVDMLLGRKIYQTGTVMKNRLGPIVKKLKNDMLFQRGEWEEWVREDDKICLIKWKDNRSVLILSSCVGSSPPTTCKRWSREHKKKIDVPQPVAVKLYNENMGGVDLCDRFLSYYRCYIHTSKWPVRMFNHFIHLMIVNCWVMYHRWCSENEIPKQRRLSLMDYKMHVGKAMINYEYVEPVARRRGRPSVVNSSDSEDVDDVQNMDKTPRRVLSQPTAKVRFDNVVHLPKLVEAKNASKYRNHGCSSKTRVICIKCEMYLCVMKNNCIEAYHKK
ncbi:piggyBac transposable element-derived protein 3-like [Schistocerca americana]|uniref:piggyBac transposable element-derived protein 3-like n=1 Tax=Schistocerca americana TaxID=7009 RepID=UPI001F4F6909|nr:piggyBac transposable element-derived protein 3-like [Schistocerca americana]